MGRRIMYQSEYYVLKTSGTYAETLEAYGLAKILNNIFQKNGIKNQKIIINDEGGYFKVYSKISVTEAMVNNTPYFEVFPYIKIKTDNTDTTSIWIIDYKREKEVRDSFRKWKTEVLYKTKKSKRKGMLNEYENKPHFDFDIFSKIQVNSLSGYLKVFNNVYKNRQYFTEILKEILLLYHSPTDNSEIVKKNIKKLEKEKKIKFKNVNALQIFNPHQGKGVNSLKSNSIRLSNIPAFWLKEYLKITGAYLSMVIKDIKISNTSWDIKFFVIEPYSMEYEHLTKLYKKFKPLLMVNTSFKLDIIAILIYSKLFIENLPEYQSGAISFSKRYKPQHFVKGFNLAYQKDLGANKAIANIGFLRLPEFIEIQSFQDGKKWINILDEHREIINAIDENNSSTTSLLNAYRQFLSTGNWDDFFEFNFEYIAFLVGQLTQRRFYIKPFSLKNMEGFFMTEKNFMPILESEGFRNIARAIRKSTISEQYARARGNNKFEIKYGVVQDLKRKSAYKEELVEYLSEFVAQYNAETARYVEKHPSELKSGTVRATVKTKDIEELISLIDEYSAPLVGKLLAAYGYALERRDEDSKKETITKMEEDK